MNTNFKFQNNTLFIFGIWDKTSIYKLKIKDFLALIQSKEVIFDFKDLKAIDTAGVRFFLALENDLKNKNIKITKEGLNSRFQTLFELCEKNYQRLGKTKKSHKNFSEYFIDLGKLSLELLKILRKFINFTGAFFTSLFLCLKNPKNFRFIAFLYHIENSAFKALPIVILTALLVGVVLAYQAAYQLAQFGANIFIVDLMGISATRELAPLIVAISDAISIIGGMMVAKLNLDISFAEFLRRFREAVDIKHIFIGLAKAPIFGFLIGLIACFRGFEVKNTTQSIGIYTTKSVVNAIFWVIAFDALFSVVLTSAGI
ncbi:ABC transporter permease [Campylobacter jejuni]|uniref:ABC transporter permease n=1 Tax=Campylobacter jejuni TaxID=197 RepID=UPI002FF2D694